MFQTVGNYSEKFKPCSPIIANHVHTCSPRSTIINMLRCILVFTMFMFWNFQQSQYWEGLRSGTERNRTEQKCIRLRALPRQEAGARMYRFFPGVYLVCWLCDLIWQRAMLFMSCHARRTCQMVRMPTTTMRTSVVAAAKEVACATHR